MDQWNDIVASLNPQEEKILEAQCSFSEVDDPHDYLQNIFSPESMVLFDKVGIPPHYLSLKVRTLKCFMFY